MVNSVQHLLQSPQVFKRVVIDN